MVLEHDKKNLESLKKGFSKFIGEEEKEMSPKKEETVHLSKHRVVMHLNKGGLHRALGVAEGTKIPKEKIDKAKNSSNKHLAAMANLAHTMEGWHHGS
jgi:hypothetical protein